ncbi:acetate/propionate family kinase [Niabella drilacis]|uniref:Acetate kinase n=1 Tax=Niabella drilacis (strain DSM 25811 / CCM 8410 / CCUG 62505 / LMG 26954 / E90) TaxID=1285928 RepID=A0A1G7A747_NIADE|nr:acetate/propionate family kinase [Niabella drilacis]SDE10317.1 acetate kinase [Niabella drilacis]
MNMIGHPYLLTVNPGSSSLKINVFKTGGMDLIPVIEGSILNIGSRECTFRVTTGEHQVLKNSKVPCTGLAAAARLVAQWLLYEEMPIAAVGYRIVQGGPAHRRPQVIDTAFLQYLGSIQPLAPTHIPDEIDVIRTFMDIFPGTGHIACFDTFFHIALPLHAKQYPLPEWLRKEGIHKYGFHGLSYEFVMQHLQKSVPEEADGKIIIAHLGNGSSLAAVHNGRAIDTTMGMTPIGGLMMGTRCGDLDPGVLLYLLTQRKMTPAALDQVLTHESGLKGVSGISADMKTLLALEAENGQVAEALDLFCYHARKMIGAMAAALNGADTLVFTGGVGEHAPAIRSRICDGLQYLGIRTGPGNENNSALISTKESLVSVRVVKTNEAYIIAQHMLQFA